MAMNFYKKIRTFNASKLILTASSSSCTMKCHVPQEPVSKRPDDSKLPPPTKIDVNMIRSLETLSLVNFEDREGIERLEAAIRVADRLSLVNTDGVEPMISVQDDEYLTLAEDLEDENRVSRDELLACSSTVVENYLVIPPGNDVFTREEEYYSNLQKNQKEKT